MSKKARVKYVRVYRDWVDIFYESGYESKLKAYSRIFNTAEINSTFYSYPAQGIVFSWARCTPADFKFSVLKRSRKWERE
ncbi:MAG: DUF72 domain-containing protein [Candidatus Methanoperedens sp.]|nr:DUF72 domain-containing protein [Candidatus Methanoperedens sp.]